MTIDTTKLRELAQAATPGPWNCELDCGSRLRIYSETNSGIVDGCGCCGSPNCDDADANFIVAANPATVLALLDKLDGTESMFLAACADLGAINKLLGLDPDDGGAEPILYEVKRLLAIEAAARNLAKVKGRHHSEQAMNQLLEALK